MSGCPGNCGDGSDRRRSARQQTTGDVTAMVIGGESFGRILTLRLVDEAENGLGTAASESLPDGSVLCLGFPARGRVGRRGVVARCVRGSTGFHIGIRYDGRLAA